MAEPKLTDLEFNILRFLHDNPEGVFQQDFTGRLATEHYIFKTKQAEFNEAEGNLYQYACMSNNWIPPNRVIVITPRGEQLYQEEFQRREKAQSINNISERKLIQDANNAKKWWVSPVIALISALISGFALYTTWHFHNSSEKKDILLEQKTDSLELKIQQSNNKILYTVDSLWKKDHKSGTSKNP